MLVRMKMIQPINWNRIQDPMDKTVWDRLTSNFWLDTKIPVSNDIPSWNTLTDAEQEMVKKVFASLTAFDTLQSAIGAPELMKLSETQHEEAVFTNIAFMESVHAKSYSTIFSTLCSTEEIDKLFRWASESKDLQSQLDTISTQYWDAYDEFDRLFSYAASVILESCLFYTGFYAPLRLAAEGKMTNTADIIRLILRDEGVHGYYIGYKFQKALAAYGVDGIEEQVHGLALDLYHIELKRVEEIYDEVGWSSEVKNFLRYNMNKAMYNLGLSPVFPVDTTEIPSYIMAALDPGTGEAHDFFSGSGASYVMGTTEETEEEDWEWE